MKGDPEFVILKYQSWLDTAKFEDKILGSIVKEFLRPTNNYVPDTPLKYNKHEFIDGCITDFVLDNSGSKNNDATANLKSVAGVSFKGSTENAVKLSGKLVRYKRLQQHDQFWPKLKEDPDVKAIVPNWTSRYRAPVCLVVGIMICEDVELSFEGKSSLERGGEVELPIGKITLAAGAPNPLGDAVDPQVNIGNNRQTVTIFKGKVGESRIFALELKKITTKGWIQKDLKLRSEGPTVEALRTAAGGGSDDEDDDEQPGIEDLVLDGLSQEEYGEMLD
jgi:hypothetical protein